MKLKYRLIAAVAAPLVIGAGTTACSGAPAPERAATFAAADADAGVRAGAEYVALGSSFAAGPGITPTKPGSPAECKRSTQNYASRVADRSGLDLTDVSCSGATTENILTKSQAGQDPQVSAVTADTRLVTVTIGGNDVNYSGSLSVYSCHDSKGKNCGSVDEDAINKDLGTVRGKIGDVVDALHDRAPDARILVVNYLTVLPGEGVCAGVPLTSEHADFERDVAARLKDATKKAAEEKGATLIDAAGASAKHHSCSGDPWVEKYEVSDGRAAYHPKPAGMQGVADLITKQLG
ncbi:SGNH/GDSL hydrolase family protein [Saccharopolyspora gloriosae]|uniref:SGNH/GDSL hydrolase family protein n=1 Tax=Saccharopolyspora gloriosae TaxID=455344 RepID=UPI001FB57A02|nr:SGNH/GDSL hydrolase family protein [Saccharopolyspora gloriosae]